MKKNPTIKQWKNFYRHISRDVADAVACMFDDRLDELVAANEFAAAASRAFCMWQEKQLIGGAK